MCKERACPRYPSLFTRRWFFSVLCVIKTSCLTSGSHGPKVLARKPCRDHKGGEKQSHLSDKDYKFEVNSHVLAELYICLLAFKYLELLIKPTISYIQLFIKAWRSGEWENEEYSPGFLIFKNFPDICEGSKHIYSHSPNFFITSRM